MFSVHCPRHRREVLLGPSDLLSLSPNTDGGFTIGYRCTCGYEGEWPLSNCQEPWPEGLGAPPGHRAA
jgi:hypothetical protein